jgi:Ca2+-binding EF-hand superfamily protein
MRKTFLVLAAVTLLSAQGALAQQAAPQPETLLRNSMRPGTTLERYLGQARHEFARLDPDGDGTVTQADADFDRAREAAVHRAAAISNILQTDLNGDGIVTREEVRQTLETRMAMFPVIDQSRPGFREQLDAEIAKLMQPDRNGDGRIDGAEMLAFAKQRLATGTAPATAMIAALAAHPEGPFIEARFLAAAEAIFRKVDADGDGTVSREEIEAARRR